jgi:hypothetical protein
LKCELKPNLIVLSPIHPACEKFEPKGEDKPVEAAPQSASEPQPETLLEQTPVAEEEKQPILPSKPLKEWRVGELSIYLFKKPLSIAGYRDGEEAFAIKLKGLDPREAAKQFRDSVLKNALLSEEEAELLAKVCKELEEILAKRSKVKVIPLERVVKDGSVHVRTSLVIKEKDGLVEAWLRRYSGKTVVEKPVAFLPEIRLLHDQATGNAFFIARAGGKILAVSAGMEGLLPQLVVQGYISRTSLNDTTLQMVLREVVKREEGELAPGLGLNGFVDPLGVGLDANDYGVEGLLAARDWILKYYPESNKKAALANVALAVAKLVTPALRKLNPTFVDTVVWNFGRGGEGKTTLLTHIVLPLLSTQVDNEKTYVLIRGAVETSPQMAFLVSINRLPLILDEQTLKALERNADILLSAVVGQGIIKIHAPRYGLLGEVRFKNLRGLIVATNVEFSRWLRRVREHATDIAFMRRVIEIEWENESLNPEAFSDIPTLKPVLGAVERVWKYKFNELVKCKDAVELAEKLFTLLGEMYGADLSAYVEAVKEVREKWEGASKSVKATDVDLVRERAYEIARQVLGTTSLTGAKVLLSIFENPDAYGVRLLKPKDAPVEEEKELNALIDRLKPDTSEEKQRLAVVLARLAGSWTTRIILKANGPLVPGSPREFLGAKYCEYKFGSGYAHGYALPISRFAEIFLLSQIEEDSRESQNPVANVACGVEPSTSQSRNVAEV